MRALIAINDGEPAKAIELLKPVPKPGPAPIGSYSSFVEMTALQALGDKAGFQRDRDRLMQAVAKRLTDPRSIGGREVARFKAGDAEVTGFEAVYMIDSFTAVNAVFLVKGAHPEDWPITIVATTQLDLQAPGRQSYYLEEFGCFQKWRLKRFDEAPDFATAKSLVMERLKGELEPISGVQAKDDLSACEMAKVVAPGLGG